jgi:hypothetical protein
MIFVAPMLAEFHLIPNVYIADVLALGLLAIVARPEPSVDVLLNGHHYDAWARWHLANPCSSKVARELGSIAWPSLRSGFGCEARWFDDLEW